MILQLQCVTDGVEHMTKTNYNPLQNMQGIFFINNFISL